MIAARGFGLGKIWFISWERAGYLWARILRLTYTGRVDNHVVKEGRTVYSERPRRERARWFGQS